jgi:phosphoribosyl-ATP pyrophosphohydrolase
MALAPTERRIRPAGCCVMKASRDYRKFADECRRLALKAENQQHKAILQEMADLWLQLAAEAEQKDVEPPE